MKIAIISDIHGNFDALSSFPEDYDELWVLGDLVNYGPEPHLVVRNIMDRASVVIRGNHDHSVVSDEVPRWGAQWKAAAETTRQHALAVLSAEQRTFLSGLPRHVKTEREGKSFFLTHAIPSNPLWGHHAIDSPHWEAEVERAGTDYLFVGHSHVPSVRKINATLIVNPGSIGQPRSGKPHASYAIWQGGEVALKTYRYPVTRTAGKLRRLRFPTNVTENLVRILQTGRVDQASAQVCSDDTTSNRASRQQCIDQEDGHIAPPISSTPQSDRQSYAPRERGE